MLDDAQPTQWSAMIQDLVRHYATLWHASDTSLPWLGPPYTSGAQRSNESTWITSLRQCPPS
jgi:hypothetical protein